MVAQCAWPAATSWATPPRGVAAPCKTPGCFTWKPSSSTKTRRPLSPTGQPYPAHHNLASTPAPSCPTPPSPIPPHPTLSHPVQPRIPHTTLFYPLPTDTCVLHIESLQAKDAGAIASSGTTSRKVELRIKQATFSHNYAQQSAGALQNGEGVAVLEDVTFFDHKGAAGGTST